MLRNNRWLLVWVVLGGLLGGMGLARHDENGAKRDATATPHKPATIKAKKGELNIDVSLKGVVEAEQMIDLSIKPEGWTQPLIVKKALEHGTPVKKGDVVLELELDKIDLAIRDLRLERNLEELAIRQAREELPILEKSLPLDLAMAERSKKQADEDLKQFLEVDRALDEANAEQMVKSAAFFLESSREELKQLQKMYRDKDLTEETEEIILKRQRFYVEMAEHWLKSAKIYRDQTLKVTLPRRELTLRDSVQKQALALEKIRNSLRPTISQKRLALEKLIYEHDKSGERLKELERDREAFTVRAPADGIVYYGKCQLGQWTSKAAVEQKLQPGGILQPAEVVMTIVTPRPIFIRADVEEKHLHWLRDGLQGKVTPAGYPDLKLPVRLVKISLVPQTAGHFDARLVLDAKAAPQNLTPGMACNIKLAAYHKKDALTIPASAVFSDDGEEDVHYVYLCGKSGKPYKHTVKIGKCNGQKTEILEGLKEGEEILAEDPNRKSSQAHAEKLPASEEK
jgi:HlyD family secretion protein